MLVGLIQLGILLWLPGAVLFRLPVWHRARRAALPADERLFWQVVLSLAVTLASTLTLGALGHYRFEYLLAAIAAASITAIVVWRTRLRLEGAAPRPQLTSAIPLLLILLCAMRFLPPAEYIIGGKDPGTYVSEGVQLAQRGTLTIEDPVVAAVPAGFRDLFFPSYNRAEYYSLRFMGFFIHDPDRGTVAGQFPHLFPAALAIGYGVDGLTGVRRTTPLLATLGVLAVYFAGVAIFGRWVGAVAAALLALHVIQVWFGRYPNAEVLMQLFVFSALLALVRAPAREDTFFAALAGVLLGLLLFLRFDAVLAIAAISATLLLGLVAGQPLRPAFFGGLAVPAIAAVPYLLGPMRSYIEGPIVFVTNLPWWQMAALVILAVTILSSVAAAAKRPAIGVAITRWFPVVAAALIAGAAIYGLFFRHPAGRLAAADAYTLRTFANFYVTVPVLLAAVLGYAVYARSAFWRAPHFYVLVAVFAVFFFYKLRIVHEYFWAARRFVPVILPATLMLASAAALGGRRFGRWPWSLVTRLVGAVFIVLAAGHYIRASAPVLAHVEFADVIPRLEALAAQIGDRDLLIVESRDAGADTHVVALPLAYIYARNVLVLNSARPDRGTFASFVEWARTRYDRVLFLGGAGTDLVSASFAARPLWSDRFEVPEYQSVVNGYPRGPRNRKFDHSLYQLVPATGASAAGEIDIGAGDDLRVIRFQAKELAEARSFRWTTERSIITLDAIAESARELTLVMADGGRPPGAPAATVMVSLDDWPLGTLEVDGGFTPYVLAIPPEVAARLAAAGAPVELRLRSTLWNPAKVLGSGDDRELGVMLDRVTIR